MEFTLTYRGRLKANGGPADKQEIRRAVHRQMQALWQQRPLSMITASQHNHWLRDDPPAGYLSLIRSVSGFRFAPLVCSGLYLIAELAITFLRPEAPGALITQGGDIDNRIKTLLDALRMPKNPGELPSRDVPQQGENPFFCLLEDDNLVTRFAVTSDRLLEPVTDKSQVLLLIHAHVKPTAGTLENLSLA